MKIRACFFGIMAVVSLTSGCACCDNPCWGFRLHPWSSPYGGCGGGGGCGGCCPAYSSPVSAPVVYRAPPVAASPDCPCGSTPVFSHPTGYPAPSIYPGNPYPPIIGNPMPLPGPSGASVPSTMPGKNQ
jgi:hypothetical protein